MRTEVIAVDPENPSADALAYAAGLLQRGGLVSFPTETVYALGAGGFERSALERLYLVKGRPERKPLIMGIDNPAWLDELSAEVPESARAVAGAFWPGPLTLVLRKSALVNDVVAAGGETVALRMPGLPLALELIGAAGMPVVIPSANISGRASPRDAAAVLADLDGRIDLLLDAGRCGSGVESSILDLSAEHPRLLRQGAVSADELALYLPDLQVAGENGKKRE